MKFGFATCVKLGLSCIEKIYSIGGSLDLLITLHDQKAKKKSGRIYLDEFSKNKQIPLIKINHINDQEVIDAINEYKLDWLFIIGWSQIASSAIIYSPKNGCIGMHPTLLPVGRGRAAIPWAIIKGLDKTGVSMFILDEGVDTGPVLGQHEIEIGDQETATQLYAKVEIAHELVMERVFPKLQDNTYIAVPQNEEFATEWEGRKPEDGELRLNMTVQEADRLIRATTSPYPGAFLVVGGKKRVVFEGRIVKSSGPNTIKFKDGFLEITKFHDVELN